MTLFDEEMDAHLMDGAAQECLEPSLDELDALVEGSVRYSNAALRFSVIGKAKPAGSKRAFVNPKTGRAQLTDDSGAPGKTWRQEVSDTGARARLYAPWGNEMLLGPCTVEFTFYRPRPKGHYGSGANAHVVKASSPPAPATRPDVLKLARAVEDALTGILWKDDAQIVDERLRKVWGEPERCEIVVRPW